MTTQEILQLLDEKRVLTAPAAVAWDEVQRQQNRLNQAAKRLNGPITVTLALNLLFAFTIFLLEQSHLMHGFLLMLGLMGGLIAIKYFVFVPQPSRLLPMPRPFITRKSANQPTNKGCKVSRKNFTITTTSSDYIT